MRVVIFGLGSIGTRYGRLLKDNFDHELFAYRHRESKDHNPLGIPEIYSFRELQKLNPDVAIITNPTYLHARTANQCASLGMHLFIEKPLSHNLQGVKELESICQKKKLTCYTAYCLRFHPVIKKMKALLKGKTIYHAHVVCTSYLPHWRPGTDYRKQYSVFAKQGGGVILDLSHELDYVEYLLGPIKQVRCHYGRISNLTVDAEDFADIFLTVKNSAPVNVHLNFLSRLDERTIKIDFKGGYLEGDLLKGTIAYFQNDKIKRYRFRVGKNDLYTEQLKYFFANLGRPSLMNGIKESKQLLEKIRDCKKRIG